MKIAAVISTCIPTHADSALDKPLTYALDLLTSVSMHAERLPWRTRLASLVLIAQVVFLVEYGYPHLPTHRLPPAVSVTE